MTIIQSRRSQWAVLAAGALALCAILGTARPAAADVVNPAGACAATGDWFLGGVVAGSTGHAPGDVLTVPRSDVVRWTGQTAGYTLDSNEGPRREISGKVELKLPVSKITIDDWAGTSVRYANQGEHNYELPAYTSGLKVKLSGEHYDGGTLTCSGSIYVRIGGGALKNPVTYGAFIGLGLSGFVLFLVSRPRPSAVTL